MTDLVVMKVACAGTTLLCCTSAQMDSSMFLDGKHAGRLLMVACDRGQSKNRHFFVRDGVSKLCFLLDMGAEISVLPSSHPIGAKH